MGRGSPNDAVRDGYHARFAQRLVTCQSIILHFRPITYSVRMVAAEIAAVRAVLPPACPAPPSFARGGAVVAGKISRTHVSSRGLVRWARPRRPARRRPAPLIAGRLPRPHFLCLDKARFTGRHALLARRAQRRRRFSSRRARARFHLAPLPVALRGPRFDAQRQRRRGARPVSVTTHESFW